MSYANEGELNVRSGEPGIREDWPLGLRNNVLDLSTCFPTSASRSPTHSFSGAAYTSANAFAFMLVAAVVAALVAAMPVTTIRSCS